MRSLDGTRGMKQIHQKHITMRIWATNSNIDHNLVAWTDLSGVNVEHGHVTSPP